MGTLGQDVRFGMRRLRKAPGFTAIALVTLAVGIGANTIMFSLVDALLFRPLHVKEPERLVYCGIRHFGFFDYPMYVDMRDDNPVFHDLIALDYGSRRGTWVQGDVVRHMNLAYVSSNYFSGLGIAPAYGRPFWPEEERNGAEPVFRQGAISTLVGLSLGILLAAGLTSLIRSGLYGVSPVDSVSIATTVAFLASTSILASYVPVRRAARVDPMVALRYE